ncbi:bacteriohemerythrin [Clostridium magnum]|uniref:Bacteriohemerythrin n=1 Tax=Clostridium magnum DSM 2767 TaxID=1121326 RepID=A0A162T597_9CLOT|nr:hemerythrin family protein [Clostridium magnum]KZL92260.1 bacteriohemerythrin [Clostridium magnum DSM 2767]SHH15859.1 hemerythrin [Clostridium magnum DSM 2767]
MFEMKDEYRLGLVSIDEQHTKLFELGDQAYKLLKDRYSIDKYDKIVEIIKELGAYAATHFKDEEEYMESIRYRKLFSQKVQHEEFIKAVEAVNFNKIDDNQDEYIMEILNFIAKWLTEHIIKEDLLITKNN